jgi:large subunit ribosomal protein L4
MNIDVFSASGAKSGTLSLPDSLFGAPINHGLMHQAVMLQQTNRRAPIAHAKSRGEVAGSTKKLYTQKHTGRARRGSVRSPLLRGGGKAFGPKSIANFERDMPKAMRHAALCSCLSYKAKQGAILGLEGYPTTIKTKDMHGLLKKLPVDIGRKILFVMPEMHKQLSLSARNISGTKSILASYLNPEDVLNARHIIFVGNAVQKAEEVFGAKKSKVRVKAETVTEETKAPKAKKTTAKKPSTKKSKDSSSES